MSTKFGMQPSHTHTRMHKLVIIKEIDCTFVDLPEEMTKLMVTLFIRREGLFP